MNHDYFIITGTSSGIGEELARSLLEKGSFVFGISRRDSQLTSGYQNYVHINFDLSNLTKLDTVLTEIFDRIDFNMASMICLVNNAAMLEPLSNIEHCKSEEIILNIQTSLVAPMVLTSIFVQLTEKFSNKRKIINISSGSGSYPAPGMSVYCTAKAGINMFTHCVGLEQSKHQNPVEIIAVDPGMVETHMQMIARGKNIQDFEMAQFFREAYQSEQLQSTDTLVKHLTQIIYKDIPTGELVKYSDI